MSVFSARSAAMTPVSAIQANSLYAPPTPSDAIDLWLNANEGPPPSIDWAAVAPDVGNLSQRYPAVGALEAALSRKLAVRAAQVLVTAGADDALARACAAMLEPGRELLLTAPTFEMIGRYGVTRGAVLRPVAWWGGTFPLEEFCRAITPATRMIAVVAPNNPTGATATPEALRALSAAAPHALLLLDAAYAEYDDEALPEAALALPNAIVVRTFSKAWGLAGLRVGYAVGPAEMIDWLRRAGQPYAVSGLSAALTARWLEEGAAAVARSVARVRAERDELFDWLRVCGAAPLRSRANFVLARFADARRMWAGLARRGIAVRAFPAEARLAEYLRITCPGDADAFARLKSALQDSMVEAAAGVWS